MTTHFYYGPDRIAFRLTDTGVIGANGNIPFHGIISRGLLNRFLEMQIPFTEWYDLAPALNTGTLPATPTGQLVKDCKVLRFAQSAMCAKKMVDNYRTRHNINDGFADIWNIKEGHTSSVWKISIHCGEHIEHFVINVARDEEAGVELKQTSQYLSTVTTQYPEGAVASVLEIDTVCDDVYDADVVVTRNEWIDNAYEVHQRINKITGEPELLMVERFVSSQQTPAHITSVLGRQFSPLESGQINNAVNKFLQQAECCLGQRPAININDGDVVWDGSRAVIVALS